MGTREVSSCPIGSLDDRPTESENMDGIPDMVGIDFETDSLRFMFDAYLAEYGSLRREIELHVELHERNINYLLLILGAIFSLSGLTDLSNNRLLQSLNSFPFLYLVLALVSLIFPILYIMRSVYVVTLEDYQYNVLAPKIAAISTMLSGHSRSAKEFISWEQRAYPSHLQGPMRWLGYSAQRKYRENPVLFLLFGLFRYIFVSFPSVCLAAAFFVTVENRWTWLEVASLLVFASAALAVLGGIVYTFRFVRITSGGASDTDD